MQYSIATKASVEAAAYSMRGGKLITSYPLSMAEAVAA